MIFVVIGVALFAYGLLVGWVGPKLGTVLACVPVLLLFAVLVNLQLDGELSSAESADFGAGLLVGMLAFLTGSNLTEGRFAWVRAWRRTREAE